MRLGFAISTSVQHDIILMDEWVGAGDAEFMAKAKERMQSRVGGSKIVVLASHSTGLLRDICNRGVVLERGRLVYSGEITSSLKYYHELLAKLRAGELARPEAQPVSGGTQVFGAVEEIRLERDSFRIRGWLINTEGAVPGGLALLINGMRYLPSGVERMRRPDVMRHFGLSNDECGFRATFALLPGITRFSELGSDFQVLGGESSEDAHAPLRIAGAVAALLQEQPRSSSDMGQ